MAKRTVEAELAELSALASAPAGVDVDAALAKALSNKTNLVVARAAGVASKLGRKSLCPQLLAALNRYLEAPGSQDKAAAAKTALAKALYEFGDRLIRSFSVVVVTTLVLLLAALLNQYWMLDSTWV